MAVSDVLDALKKGEHVRFAELAELSNLPSAMVEDLRSGWSAIPLHQRRDLVERLAELTTDNLELDFDEVFKVAAVDEDSVVREAAIEGLAISEDERVSALLVRMLKEDPEDLVRAAAAGALATFAVLDAFEELEPRYSEPLRSALRYAATDETEDVEVRSRSLEALGALALPWVDDIIRAYYEASDRRMQQAAIRAMGRTCEERWLVHVIDELESEDPERRYDAALAVGNIASAQAAEPVAGLLNDEDTEVRLAAIWALGEIGGPTARQLLEEAMEEPRTEAEFDAIEEALIAAAFQDEPLGFLLDFDQRAGL